MNSPTPNDPSRTAPGFHQRVQRQFGRQACHYDTQAQLQRGIAWRLAHHCRHLAIPPGPRADLGAGSGLVGAAWTGEHQAPLLQLDLCPELLARNPLAPGHGTLVWDLNQGLPLGLQQAALLTSSFALQWLDAPGEQLEHWCTCLQPGGWLALAVPTRASFSAWRQAAQRAAIPFTALELPDANQLLSHAKRHLQLQRCQRLRFSRSYASGLHFLHQIRQLGAGTSRHQPLAAAQLRRLLAQWPSPTVLDWEVLLLVGQRAMPGQATR